MRTATLSQHDVATQRLRFLPNGAHDVLVLQIDAEVQAAEEIPQVKFDDAVSDGRIRIIGKDVDVAYVNAVAALSQSSSSSLRNWLMPLRLVPT